MIPHENHEAFRIPYVMNIDKKRISISAML